MFVRLMWVIIIPLPIIDAVFKFSGRKGFTDEYWKKMLENGRERYDEQALLHFRAKVSMAYSFCAVCALFTVILFAGTGVEPLAPLPFLCVALFDRRYLKNNFSTFEKLPSDEKCYAANAKRRLTERKIWLSVTGIVVTVLIGFIAYAESDPRVEVDYLEYEKGVVVRGLHGASVPLSMINDITLFEESFEDLSRSDITGSWLLGKRYQFFGAIRGYFQYGLMYVHPARSPTIRIEYIYPLPRLHESDVDRFLTHNIFISLRDPDSTRELYERLRTYLQ